MEDISGFPMATIVKNEAIYNKLRELGFSDRNICALDKNYDWKTIKFRNHKKIFVRIIYTQFTFRQTAIKELMSIFNISETPVRRAIKAGFQVPNESGRCTSLPFGVEKNLIAMIREREIQGNPIVHVEFCKHVQENHKIAATTGWLQYFVQSYSGEIQKVKSYPQDDLCMIIPREFLTAHFTNMKQIVEGCCSELCFILDEVGSSDWEERKIKKFISLKIQTRKRIAMSY